MNDYYSRASKPAVALDDETKYKLLSNGRRRSVIEELHDDSPLTKSELADKLTKRVSDEENETPSGQERKRIYISLHQQHIPKLMENSVILEGDDGYVLGPTAHALLDEMGYPESEGREETEEPENGESGGGFRDRLGGLLKGSS